MTFLNFNINEYSIKFDILNIHSFLLIAVSTKRGGGGGGVSGGLGS